jgi:hypothetical protein
VILSILVGITSSLDTIPGVWVLQVQGNTKVARVNFDNSRKLESQLTFIPNSVTGTGSTWQLKYIDVENGGRGRLLKSAADGKILFQTAISQHRTALDLRKIHRAFARQRKKQSWPARGYRKCNDLPRLFSYGTRRDNGILTRVQLCGYRGATPPSCFWASLTVIFRIRRRKC